MTHLFSTALPWEQVVLVLGGLSLTGMAMLSFYALAKCLDYAIGRTTEHGDTSEGA